ncbi:MAG: hypothetical protein Q8P49_04365 [Candidatus Liptonbacteria bacterium]|nr:hypothetical protein [Candidatus Liptonbacteria bacterium]
MEKIPASEGENKEMEKILSFESGKEHYEADAFVSWCFDDRFSAALEALKEKRGFKYSDVVEWAGGAKDLASSITAEREAQLGQIKKSIVLHKTKRVVLMVHVDCGAFGGSKAFGNDREEERGHLVSQLNAAEQTVKEAFPGIDVEKVMVDFDGIYRI